MTSKPRCVVVDDDPSFLELTRLLLMSEWPECEVMPFHSAVEAANFLRHTHVDLIISDYHMPELNGLQLIKLVRKADKRVPIVVISDSAIEAEALHGGASMYIPKSDIVKQFRSIRERLDVISRA